MLIKIENLKVLQKENLLFNNFNLEIDYNSRIGIYAPTGTGKTTLLNIISGIITDNETLHFEGKIIKNDDLHISYVFQEPRLLENISVLKNITLPLEKILSADEAEKKALILLEKLFLLSKINTNPGKLSGGEKQRLSLARAFAFPSNLLLLDEPFHSQDSVKKDFLINFTDEIIEKEKRALVIISHDKNDLEKLGCQILTEKDFIKNYYV